MTKFLLGSQSEDMVADGERYAYVSGGLLHAVHPSAVPDDPDAVLAYAVCGTPVRVWREQRFDPSAAHAHPRCLPG